MGCCWVVHMIFRSWRTLCNTCIPWGSFYFPYCCPIRCLCVCVPCTVWPFFFKLGAMAIETWKRMGSGKCAFILFFLFMTPSPGCRTLSICGCVNVSAIFGALWIVLWRRLLLHWLLQPCHSLTDHVCQFPWRLRFLAISWCVWSGEDSEDLADGIRVVAVVGSVLGHNLAIGNADFCRPCMLFRPFCVGEYNDHSEVDVHLHSVPLWFSASAIMHSTLVTTVSLQSKIVPAMLTNCRLMFVASDIFTLSVIAVSSWWIWYLSTYLKSLFSVVCRMRLVMSFPTILVIPSAIPSLTPIAARQKTFFLLASSWASLLVVISGLTVLASVLTR